MNSVFWWVVLPLLLTSTIYLILSGGYLIIQQRPGMALAFVGYVIANVGLIWDAIAFKT